MGTRREPPVVLSAIIPALNAERWLGEQLNALVSQEMAYAWELILVDNGSSDQTVALFDTFTPRPSAWRRIDASRCPGQAYARNIGATAAMGEMLVFLDADDVAGPGYLAAMYDSLSRHDLVAARLDRASLNPGERGADWLGNEDDTGQPYLGFLPAAAGGTLGVRREIFERLGGFDAAFPPAEDIDFCWRAQLGGYRFVVARDAVLYYRNRDALKAIFHQSMNYGMVHPALYERYREAGMPRRRGMSAARFYIGPVTGAVRLRNRGDLANWISWLGLRVGHVRGSIRYRVWYP